MPLPRSCERLISQAVFANVNVRFATVGHVPQRHFGQKNAVIGGIDVPLWAALQVAQRLGQRRHSVGSADDFQPGQRFFPR